MTDRERASILERFGELYYTQANLDRKQRELADLQKALEAEERELCEKEKRLLAKREKLLGRMTETQRRWEALRAELEELLYSGMGVVTQLRDGYFGPFDENERIRALCVEARQLIGRQGYADIEQFNFFVLMLWELSMRLDDTTADWLSDYLDALTDALTASEA